MSELPRVRRWAEALIALHLDATWSFDFDRARTRAGACDHARRRITVSRHIAQLVDDDDIHQVLLHEVAHALAGARAGHGAQWRRIAAGLGYAGSRLYDGPTATGLAPWVGSCPAGHTHYRHRRPARPMSCAKCSRRYDARHLIRWERRAA